MLSPSHLSRHKLKLLVAVGLATLVVVVVTDGVSESPDEPGGLAAEVADPGDVYDPVAAGEPLPDGWRRLLRRDQIPPIYAPVFVAGTDIDWPPEMLVIGVAGPEASKAYPVPYLNRREIVNDDLDGIPILVTW